MTQSTRDLHVALQHGTQQQMLHEPQEASEAQSQVEYPALPDACNAGEAPAAVAQAQAAPPLLPQQQQQHQQAILQNN